MRNRSIPMVVALLALTMAGPARADLVLQASDFVTTPGGTGSFLVTLENTGPTDATLSAYEIQMTTDVPGLSFTGVSAPMATDPAYVFPGGDGPYSSDFSPPFPGPPVTTFTAIDYSVESAGYDILTAGQTYGVLEVSYSVDASAPLGGGQVSFVSPGVSSSDLTQLSDGSYNLVDFTTNDGTASVVPEPSGFTLLALAAVAVGRCLGGRARRSSALATPRSTAAR